MSDSSLVVNEKLNIRDAFRSFKDWRYGLWALISLSLGVPVSSVNNFLPQIVASLGYSTIKTNLYTVAPNIVGTIALLVSESTIVWNIPVDSLVVGFDVFFGLLQRTLNPYVWCIVLRTY
jgi:hypothetical protein